MLRQDREERRRLLTRGERMFAWSLALLPSVLVPLGVALLVWTAGAGHAIGIALLIVSLLVASIPISPILRSRVRRREQEAEPVRRRSSS